MREKAMTRNLGKSSEPTHSEPAPPSTTPARSSFWPTSPFSSLLGGGGGCSLGGGVSGGSEGSGGGGDSSSSKHKETEGRSETRESGPEIELAQGGVEMTRTNSGTALLS